MALARAILPLTSCSDLAPLIGRLLHETRSSPLRIPLSARAVILKIPSSEVQPLLQATAQTALSPDQVAVRWTMFRFWSCQLPLLLLINRKSINTFHRKPRSTTRQIQASCTITKVRPIRARAPKTAMSTHLLDHVPRRNSEPSF